MAGAFARVHVPTTLAGLLPMWVPIAIFGRRVFDDHLGIACAGILAGVLLGWLSWAIAAPRWRLWAYRRVDDLEALDTLAIEDKLIWAPGSLIGRLEYRPAWLRAELADIERRKRKVLP